MSLARKEGPSGRGFQDSVSAGMARVSPVFAGWRPILALIRRNFKIRIPDRDLQETVTFLLDEIEPQSPGAGCVMATRVSIAERISIARNCGLLIARTSMVSRAVRLATSSSGALEVLLGGARSDCSGWTRLRRLCRSSLGARGSGVWLLWSAPPRRRGMVAGMKRASRHPFDVCLFPVSFL